jgi:hypothetical protein
VVLLGDTYCCVGTMAVVLVEEGEAATDIYFLIYKYHFLSFK